MIKKLRTECILSGKNINIHSYNIQMDSLPFIFFQPMQGSSAKMGLYTTLPKTESEIQKETGRKL